MSQDSENWELLQTLFDLAVATPEPDRERVLMERCGEESIVRRTLAIVKGANQAGKKDDASMPADHASRRMGPYSLTRLLGSVGIGTVYLAGTVSRTNTCGDMALAVARATGDERHEIPLYFGVVVPPSPSRAHQPVD